MKQFILATVLTLVMLSPAWAADFRFQPGPLLAASKQEPQRNGSGNGNGNEERNDKRPPMVIIKGKGGKVTGVEREPEKRPPQKR